MTPVRASCFPPDRSPALPEAGAIQYCGRSWWTIRQQPGGELHHLGTSVFVGLCLLLLASEVALGCSGPGAMAGISAAVEYGFRAAAVVGAITILILVVWGIFCRRWAVALAHLGLIATHPAWTVSAVHGDCGMRKVQLSSAYILLALVAFGIALFSGFRSKRLRVIECAVLVGITMVLGGVLFPILQAPLQSTQPGDPPSTGRAVPSYYISFSKVSAPVGQPGRSSEHVLSLTAAVEVSRADRARLDRLISQLTPKITERIRTRIARVAPSPGRKMGPGELRRLLKKDVRRIFNEELLQVPYYRQKYQTEMKHYQAKLKDPKQAGQAVMPGPVLEVLFTEFSF